MNEGAMHLCRVFEGLGMPGEPTIARDTVSWKKLSRFILLPKFLRGRRSAYVKLSSREYSA